MNILFSDGNNVPYNGNSLNEKPLGASWSAIINLSKFLCRRGHNVAVLNNCDRHGVFEGVYYPGDLERLKKDNIQFDFTVFNRNPVESGYLGLQELGISVGKRILWNHDAGIEESYDKLGSHWQYVHATIHKSVCGSEWLKALYEKTHGDRLKIKVVPLGVDTSIFKPLPDPHRKDVCFLGCVVQNRGIQNVIKAFDIAYQKDNELKLFIIGSSLVWGYQPVGLFSDNAALDKELQDYVDKYYNVVTAFGAVPVNYVAGILRHMGVMVYPSWIETFCVSVIEAQASGVPVITGRYTALTERGTDRKSIYFTDYRPEDLAYAILEVTSDDYLYDTIRQDGLNLARIVYNYDRIAYLWEKEILT